MYNYICVYVRARVCTKKHVKNTTVKHVTKQGVKITTAKHM